eukprot:COSAG06_NODE_963_length_11306_cov_5.786919_4_plen_80_part_00
MCDGVGTVYPLNSLLHTKQWAIQMEGWLNGYKEGGWLPSWSAPGAGNAFYCDAILYYHMVMVKKIEYMPRQARDRHRKS